MRASRALSVVDRRSPRLRGEDPGPRSRDLEGSRCRRVVRSRPLKLGALGPRDSRDGWAEIRQTLHERARRCMCRRPRGIVAADRVELA